MNASIALHTATVPARAQVTAAGREFSLLAALSKALELTRLVGDTGSVNAKTVAKVRAQILAA
jgi:hypothetical protein